jgi:hypothetical protein
VTGFQYVSAKKSPGISLIRFWRTSSPSREPPQPPSKPPKTRLPAPPTDPANKGFKIWYSVVGQGETPPANPDDLRKSFYTKRKKDVLDFEFGDSGKTAYFAVQIENEGKKGPWGPLTSALIP